MEISLRAFLKEQRERLGNDEAFIRFVRQRMQEQVFPESLNSYFKINQSAEGHFRRGIQMSSKTVVSLEQVEKCLRSMGILSFTIDFRMLPWNQLRSSSVVVVVGTRALKTPIAGDAEGDVEHSRVRQVVSAKDMESLARFSNFLSHSAHGDCRIEVDLAPANLTDEAASQKLDALLKRSDVGAVLVAGSPVVNALCAPASELVVGEGKASPARFRWSSGRKQRSWIEDSHPCAEDEAGLYDANGKKLVGRDSDRMIVETMLKKTRTREPTFRDCGVLMVDCSRKPIVVVAAGHGYAGTQACLEALEDQEAVSHRLMMSRAAESAQNDPNFIGINKIFELIEVECAAPTFFGEPSRATLNHDMGIKDWNFVGFGR